MWAGIGFSGKVGVSGSVAEVPDGKLANQMQGHALIRGN